MTRVLRITVLAPDIVEAILSGMREPEVKLAQLLEAVTQCWEVQRAPLSDVVQLVK